jgi:hypothetical protein
LQDLARAASKRSASRWVTWRRRFPANGILANSRNPVVAIAAARRIVELFHGVNTLGQSEIYLV